MCVDVQDDCMVWTWVYVFPVFPPPLSYGAHTSQPKPPFARYCTIREPQPPICMLDPEPPNKTLATYTSKPIYLCVTYQAPVLLPFFDLRTTYMQHAPTDYLCIYIYLCVCMCIYIYQTNITVCHTCILSIYKARSRFTAHISPWAKVTFWWCICCNQITTIP
jgi:hypothetical protein